MLRSRHIRLIDGTCGFIGIGSGEGRQYKVKQYNSRQNSCINEVAMDRQTMRKCCSVKKKRTSSSISRSLILYTIYLFITYLLLPSSSVATQVKWQPNNNVKPEDQAAHNAPRSQKYWDENNIKRPDYAKTDAEVAAERGEKGGSGGLLGIFLKVSIGIVLISVLYALITGDWATILNSPVGSVVCRCLKWVFELMIKIGMKQLEGNRLGTTGTNNVGSSNSDDAEARRKARLARFDDNTKNMLDDMKTD